jgi:hypothetical protein
MSDLCALGRWVVGVVSLLLAVYLLFGPEAPVLAPGQYAVAGIAAEDQAFAPVSPLRIQAPSLAPAATFAPRR